jgi:hypothetical protein
MRRRSRPRELGFEPRPVEETFADTIRWLVARPRHAAERVVSRRAKRSGFRGRRETRSPGSGSRAWDITIPPTPSANTTAKERQV